MIDLTLTILPRIVCCSLQQSMGIVYGTGHILMVVKCDTIGRFGVAHGTLKSTSPFVMLWAAGMLPAALRKSFIRTPSLIILDDLQFSKQAFIPGRKIIVESLVKELGIGVGVRVKTKGGRRIEVHFPIPWS